MYDVCKSCVFFFDGRWTKVSDKESEVRPDLFWQNQSKVWNKMQEDRQDCTLFIFIEIREKHIIQTSVVLSVCEMLFHAFSLWVGQSQLRADLRILLHQHDALILNWLPFVNYITIKLRLSAWNDDVWTLWYSIRRYTPVSVTYIILGGIITFWLFKVP